MYGEKVEINGKEYVFCNRINEEKEIFKSFNELGKSSFGLSFDSVGGKYEPHVLVDGNTVCANISVNQITFIYNGERRCYIQLGTVMTKKEYRKQGLSRWIMEWILNKWKDQCDSIYLFGNDSVLEFYPKFGFVKEEEHEYYIKSETPCLMQGRKLDMSLQENWGKVQEKYKEGQPFSKFFMTENEVLLDFYANGVYKDGMYELPEENVIVFAEYEGDKCFCHDIYGRTDASLQTILQKIAREDTKEIILGFTPEDKRGFEERIRKEEDCTLFILKGKENLFQKEKMMFPIISHA